MDTISEKYHIKYKDSDNFLGLGWRLQGEPPCVVREELAERIRDGDLAGINFYANALYFSETGTNEEFDVIEKAEDAIKTRQY